MSRTWALRGTLLLLLTLCFATPGQAATTITTEPAAPDTDRPVTLVLFTPCTCPGHDTAFTRNGFVIDIAHGDGCVSACVSDETMRYNLGLLPPGVYTVRHYRISNPAASQVIGTFAVVAQRAIPTLDVKALAALALAFSVISMVALRR